MEGLDWQTIQLPLAAGLLQRSDDRAKQPPYLDIAKDVQFDELGGLQTRYPYSAYTNAILGGGSLTNCRKLYANGRELLVFTDTGLYSWNAQLSKWVFKATHLAVKTEEEPVFITTEDQFGGDRAELDGVIVYAWETSSDAVEVGAIDKATGARLLDSYSIASARRVRVTALETAFLISWIDVINQELTSLLVESADVATISSITPTVISASTLGEMYDVQRIPGDDAAIGALSLGAGYRVFKLTAAGSLTSSDKIRDTDGPIAVACTPDGASLQVVRVKSASAEEIRGDLITISSLADTAHVNVKLADAYDSPVNQIAACFRSVQDSGEYRCYAFWHSDEDPASALFFTTESNWINTAGAIGTVNTRFAPLMAVASRAFDYAGQVYVHLAFAQTSEVASLATIGRFGFGSQLQNSYFLFRDDGLLCAKIAPSKAGGFSENDGHLPNVALVEGSTGYAWCGVERRIVPTEFDHAYADRGPRDVRIMFDSNEARRCVRLGETLYITGAELLQYDGSELVEVGFHVFPNYFALNELNGGSGSVEDGTYAYKPTWRSQNGKGEVDRSTTASIGTVTLSGGTPQRVNASGFPPLVATHKGTSVSLELWRTAKNPGDDVPFFLVTSLDPADTTGANRYINNDLANDTAANEDIDDSTWTDNLADADLLELPQNPEVGLVLEYMAPPPAMVAIASADRLFLSAIPGDPDRVVYSRQRGENEVASFHEELSFVVPREGGEITALGFLNETLIVFRETAIYALPGDGIDNAQGGSNFGPARLLSNDVGAVSHESVALTPSGLVFKSSKGWYLLNRGWSVEYIGASITDYDSEEPLAVHLVETQHQVRILTASRMLVWDYLAKQWAEWTVASGLDACLYSAAHHYLTATGPAAQLTTYTGLTFGLDVETAWIKPADLQGFVRIRKLQLLGALMSSDVNVIRIRIAYNYDDSSYVDDKYWDISPTTINRPLQLKIGPSRQQIQSIKIRITPMIRTEVISEDPEEPTITYGPPTGEAIKLTGLALEVGFKRGAYPRLPAAQRS